MFIGDVNMWRSFVVGQDREEHEERDHVDAPQPAVRVAAACATDHVSTSARERVADERPLLEARAGRSSAMRNASVRKPVTPMHEERAEDHRVLGLGLDADAVRALHVAAHDRPHDADEEHQPARSAAERVAPRSVAVQELQRAGELVVELEHHGHDEQDEEAEVDAASA